MREGHLKTRTHREVLAGKGDVEVVFDGVPGQQVGHCGTACLVHLGNREYR